MDEQVTALATADIAPSYHDLHVTTANLDRVSIFNLPYDFKVSCTRITGWRLCSRDAVLAGEYESEEEWLILDVAGHVICNSRDRLRHE